MHAKNGWRINHTQYVGKNFFLIEFDEVVDRDKDLVFAPWFFGRKFMYTFPWKANFDVTTGDYHMLPVWVEFPSALLLLREPSSSLHVASAKFYSTFVAMREAHTQMIKPASCGIYEKQSHTTFRSRSPKTSLSGSPFSLKTCPSLAITTMNQITMRDLVPSNSPSRTNPTT